MVPPSEKLDRRWLVGCVLVAAALRFFRIGHQSLWIDEMISLQLATWASGADFWQGLLKDIHGPWGSLLLHGWAELGRSEAWLRTLYALPAVATVPLVFVLAHDLFGRPAGRIAGVAAARSALEALGAADAGAPGLRLGGAGSEQQQHRDGERQGAPPGATPTLALGYLHHPLSIRLPIRPAPLSIPSIWICVAGRPHGDGPRRGAPLPKRSVRDPIGRFRPMLDGILEPSHRGYAEMRRARAGGAHRRPGVARPLGLSPRRSGLRCAPAA